MSAYCHSVNFQKGALVTAGLSALLSATVLVQTAKVEAATCSSDLIGSLALSDRLYRDMRVYEEEGQQEQADAQRSNLLHQLDLANDEGGACRDVSLLLDYYRLRALYLAEPSVQAQSLMAESFAAFKKIPTPREGAWYASLQDNYQKAMALGLSNKYPRDAASLKAIIYSLSPAGIAARAAADAPHLAAETKIAQADLDAVNAHFAAGRNITLSVSVGKNEMYTYTIRSAVWNGINQSDRDDLVRSLQSFATKSYLAANPNGSATPNVHSPRRRWGEACEHA